MTNVYNKKKSLNLTLLPKVIVKEKLPKPKFSIRKDIIKSRNKWNIDQKHYNKDQHIYYLTFEDKQSWQNFSKTKKKNTT